MSFEIYSNEIQNILMVQEKLLNIKNEDLYNLWKTFEVMGYFKKVHGLKFIINEIQIAAKARVKDIKAYAEFFSVLYRYRSDDPLLSLIQNIDFPKDTFFYAFTKEFIRHGIFNISKVMDLLPESIHTNPLENQKHGFSNDQWGIFIFFCDLIKEYKPGYYIEVTQFIENNTKETSSDYIEIDNAFLSNIIFNFPKYESNNFELLEPLVETGWPMDSLEYHIIIDDVEYMKDLILNNEITINSSVNKDNPFAIPETKNATIFEFSALYSSISCFKYLFLSNAKTTANTVKYLFSSDNNEIFKMYEKIKNTPVLEDLDNAVHYKHNDAIKWILSKYPQRQVHRNKLFANAMKEHNLELALSLMNEKPVDVNSDDGIVQSVIEMDSLDLLKLFKSKGCYIRNITRTLFACKNGNDDILKYLLDNNAEYKAKIGFNQNPLIAAIKSNSLECVKILLERGADPNTCENKMCCLAYACSIPNIEIVKALIEYGAFVNGVDKNTTKPIVIAAENGFLDIVKYLIESGADFDDTPSNSNLSPLTAACKNDHVKVVEYLLSIGVNPTDAHEPQALPINIAKKYQSSQVLSLLLEDSNTETTSISQLLLDAIQKRDTYTIKALVDKKFKFGYMDSQKRTALHYAAETNREIVEYMINHGFEVNAADEKGVTPLHLAISKNNYECTRVLLEHNADINASTVDGYTPIRIAAQNKRFNLVQLLLSGISQNKPNLEIPDKNMNTPLMAICSQSPTQERTDMISILLNAGANPNSKNNREINCLYNLLLHKPTIRELNDLILHKAEVNTISFAGVPIMNEAAKTGDLDVFNFLIENGGDIKVISKEKDTCLHESAKTSNVNIAEIILASGINVNSKNKKGRTPIFNAIISQKKNMIEFLLKNGADINEIDNDGNNALLVAMRSDKVPTINYIKYLNSLGINLLVKNKNKENLKTIAAGFKRKDILTYLNKIQSDNN